MQLLLSTWPEIETYLTKSKGIVIPIGSVEQHGPTGLIGTDAICPEVIAATAAEQAGFLVGPTFSVGCAQHHLAFPGSMTLRPSTMIAVVLDWVNSLARHGFQRLYFLNGHGGNIATLEAGFAEVYAQSSFQSRQGGGTPVVCRLQNWWELDGVPDLCASLYGAADGDHATASEVAVTYAAYPDHIKQAKLDPEIAPTGDFTDAADYRARFPDGRIGSNPGLANAEDGRRLVSAATTALIKDVTAFFADPAP